MGVNALQVVLRLLCAFDGERWLRIAATMVEDDNIEAQKHMHRPGDGNTLVFYLKDATATFSSFTAAPKTVTF